MKILFFDCRMGLDANRIAASLLGLVKEKESLITKLNALSIPGVHYSYQEGDPFGDKLFITIEESLYKQKADPGEIERYIDRIKLSFAIKKDIKSIINCIEEAKKSVYHKGMDKKIPFPEESFIEVVANAAAVCFLMDHIHPDRVKANPLPLGKASPAAARILRNLPVYAAVTQEPCTALGAAILKHYVSDYDTMPVMLLKAAGYGMGNTYREGKLTYITSYLGEWEKKKDFVCLLHANIDDMTGEELGFAQEMIWEAGALDVYTTSIFMKKNRPAVMLSCICKEEKKKECMDAFFRYTSTLGLRMERMERELLEREIEKEKTQFGDVRLKTNSYQGQKRSKIEYDDLKNIARNKRISLKEASKLF